MPKMRLGWYAGASTALAGGVVVSAFHQRANYYSAMVYLAQSNFCLIVMINFTLLLYSSFIFALTRLCFGRLRAIEVEVLTERAWFAITETCLAMTIFRDEIGAWFLIMFTSLVTGKVWGWICDGRVEVLEQQPPANPRLFHTRLSISLALSFLYDILILKYATQTVIQQAKRNMMVLFLFEFAVLTTSSWRTALRYVLSLAEQQIIKQQIQKKLLERRAEVRQQREEMIAERARTAGTEEQGANQEALPDENDIEEMDIEVPGWTAKGEWVLWLDLVTDMIKLAIYVAFFFMLLTFFGFPIHIIRDLFLTTRDFFKRLRALLRYRKAIQEMDKYPDATEEDLSRENTCIICREEMRPWDATGNPGAIDRVRPKKLPCGHILHLGCLKSWLERQQVCPTCRSPVTGPAAQPEVDNAAALRIQIGGGFRPAQGQQPAANGPAPNLGQNQGPAQPPPAQQQPGQPEQQQNNGPRVFNIGPFRVGLARNPQQFNQLLGRWPAFQQNRDGAAAPAGVAPPPAPNPMGQGPNPMGQGPNPMGQGPTPMGQAPTPAGQAPTPVGQAPTQAGQSPVIDQMFNTAQQLNVLMDNVLRSFQNLVGVMTQLQETQRMLTELYRLQSAARARNDPAQAEGERNTQPPGRSIEVLLAEARRLGQIRHQLDEMERRETLGNQIQDQFAQLASLVPQAPTGGAQAPGTHRNPMATNPYLGNQVPPAPYPQAPPVPGHNMMPHNSTTSRHGTSGYSIPSGSPELPEGLAIPPGWSLMPLQRLDGHHVQHTQSVQHAGTAQQPGEAASSPTVQTSAPPQYPPVPWASATTPATDHEALGPVQPTPMGTTASNDDDNNSSRRENPPAASNSPLAPVPATADAAAPSSAPQWGGTAQLFSNPLPSAAYPGTSPSTATSTAPASTSSSQRAQLSQHRSASPPVRPKAPSSGGSTDEDSDSSNSSSSSGEEDQQGLKAKAKAVTVESDDDDEDSD